MQLIRSLTFNALMYLAMLVLGVWYLPQAIFSRDKALEACKVYCAWVRWSAERIVGLRTEVRGPVPTGECIVAAKHQSFLDIIIIFSAVPRGRFIMKSILKWAPILGWFALRIGCVPVDRGKRSEAIRKMVADVKSGALEPGQLIIYPQGTRVAPGVFVPYKIGAAILQQETGQAVVPAATNVGVFWPRHGFLRRPGLAVVEFLPAIEPGMEPKAFLARLQAEVEGTSDRLMSEAGWQGPVLPDPGPAERGPLG